MTSYQQSETTWISVHVELLWLVVLLASCSVASAGKFGRTLDIGKPAPAWKNLPGVDGKKHSLEDLKASEVVVVVFTCNSCPYATDYEDRIIALAKKYCVPSANSAQKESLDVCTTAKEEQTKHEKTQNAKAPRVALVAINVNKVKEDLLPAMKQRAEKKKFPFPYLFDETQQIAAGYGAIWTPEFFVLNKKREIVYMGALDDSTDAKKIKQHYVDDAVRSVLDGKKLKVTETPAIGCQIRWERRSRSRKRKKKASQSSS